MTVKYLQNKNDSAVYRVNFQTMKFALVKTDHNHGFLPDISGNVRPGGFAHSGELDFFREVPNPLQ